MPDITMCNGVGCEIKEICYRYKATPSEFTTKLFCQLSKQRIYNVIIIGNYE
jgi:hypothetical protein